MLLYERHLKARRMAVCREMRGSGRGICANGSMSGHGCGYMHFAHHSPMRYLILESILRNLLLEE